MLSGSPEEFIMRHIPQFLILATFVLVVVPACGGGGGGDNEGTLLLAVGLPDLDGTIQLESNTGLCEIDAVAALLTIGENEESPVKFRTFWGFVSFDLSAVPAGATIQSATAHLRLATATGDNIFGAGLFGNVVMEHVDIGSFLGAPDDMTTPSLTGELVGGDASPTFLAVDATLELKEADITAEVVRDITDGRSKTTLRLRFQEIEVTDGDLAADRIQFFPFDPADTANAQRPFLEIRFTE